MDIKTELVKQVNADLQRTHAQILQSFPQSAITIQEILLHAKNIHDLLLIKTDSTAIILRELYNQTDFTSIHNIYRQSLTTLLLTIDFKIQAQLTKLALLITSPTPVSAENLHSI